MLVTKVDENKNNFATSNWILMIQKNSFITFSFTEMKLSQFQRKVKLGFNEHSVITNEYFGPKSSFTTQINPVITNVYNRVSLYFYFSKGCFVMQRIN